MEDLPEEENFETIGDEDNNTNNTNNSSIISNKKWKTLADLLEMHIKKREEKKGWRCAKSTKSSSLPTQKLLHGDEPAD